MEDDEDFLKTGGEKERIDKFMLESVMYCMFSLVFR